MPPKSKKNAQALNEKANISTSPDAKSDVKSPDATLLMSNTTLPDVPALEAMLDSRFKIQMKELNDVVLNYNKSTQDQLKSIKNCQEFISDKFDELLKSVSLLQEENIQLKTENTRLRNEMSDLNQRISKLDEEQESINLYSRRDCLEFHGIPEYSGENTEELVKRVGNLVRVEIGPSDISVSHRLPSKRGRTPAIIAKFTKRSTRDKLFNAKASLRNYNSSDVGIARSSEKLYINESLTQKARDLFSRVRDFKRIHGFKYAWTKYGKSFLKQNDDARAVSFGSRREFDNFKADFD